MSVNHFSSNLPETLCYTQPHHPHPFPIMDYTRPSPPPPTTTTFNFNLNTHHPIHETEKEPMFEKPLTPSDVGKLNRLVIPKQHAEKYFPLTGADAADHQKGLLLGFEDEAGKPWRFRYSYWNSSQSYVLTKGWSRFVKEKRLDAGDVVLFERHRLDSDRIFIGWRRRSAAPTPQPPTVAGGQVNGWNTGVLYDAQFAYPTHHLPVSLPLPYQPDCLHAGESREERGNGKATPRRVRLFGVNLDCPEEPNESITPDGSSQGEGGQPHYQYYHNNMNINFNQGGM